MTGGSLRNAILQKADLSRTWLEDVDFTNADLNSMLYYSITIFSGTAKVSWPIFGLYSQAT